MKNFELKLTSELESFNLIHILECGQCFRWEKQEDNSYIGVVNDSVVKIYEEDGVIKVKGVTLIDNIEEYLNEYFDLDTNYELYKKRLSKIDKYMKNSIDFGYGIRILNQDLWETIISFIISANNNIPRIKKIINAISKEYGNRIVFEDNEYYTFPSPESLSKASVEDLRKLGLGFRDKRVHKTTKMILEKEVDLDVLRSMDNTEKIKEELLKLDGIGEKVADCILLFALKRRDAFPIDVWVRRVMNDLYVHEEDEEKVNKKELRELANNKFGDIAGLAQQYLFYWRREIS